jgi:hypothetical protein
MNEAPALVECRGFIAALVCLSSSVGGVSSSLIETLHRVHPASLPASGESARRLECDRRAATVLTRIKKGYSIKHTFGSGGK